MTAKEYLQSIKAADTMIKEMLRERERLMGMRYQITQKLKPVMVAGGSGRGGFTSASDKIIDLEAEITRKIDQYVDLQREAGALLRKLKNPKHYSVLHKHYVMFESLEKIAVDMNYCYRNVCYLHGRALQAFQRVLDARDS